MIKEEWHALSKKEGMKRLESSEGGLSEEEAGKRLEKYGQNKIEEVKRGRKILSTERKKATFWDKFLYKKKMTSLK